MISAEPLRWGILSTALINDKVLAGAVLTREADVVAVASRTTERAQAFATRWQIPRAYGDYDALLHDADVEAVYIPLPNGLHHPWTLRALESGKHVLCEKPYSRRPDEVREAFDLAARLGLLLSEAYMYRYHPQTSTLAAAVSGGLIGDLRLITSSFSWPTDAPGDIRLDLGLGGGSLMDVGCYCVSAARLLAGEPRSVTAQSVTGNSGVDVSFCGTMSFDRDVLAHFDSGFHLPDRSGLEVVGTAGVLRVSDPWHCVDIGLTLTLQGSDPTQLPTGPGNSYRLELEAFADQVRGRGATALGRADALGQAVAIDALYRAASSGCAVELS